MKTKIALLFLLILNFSGCIGNQKADRVLVHKEENFDKFSKVFYSDSLFQTSRIIFPLVSDLKDSLANKSGQTSNSTLNKTNWRMLSNDYFKEGDSIATIYGRIYKRKLIRSNSQVEDYIYIENSGFFEKVIFTMKDGKWYLTDYIESDN